MTGRQPSCSRSILPVFLLRPRAAQVLLLPLRNRHWHGTEEFSPNHPLDRQRYTYMASCRYRDTSSNVNYHTSHRSNSYVNRITAPARTKCVMIRVCATGMFCSLIPVVPRGTTSRVAETMAHTRQLRCANCNTLRRGCIPLHRMRFSRVASGLCTRLPSMTIHSCPVGLCLCIRIRNTAVPHLLDR